MIPIIYLLSKFKLLQVLKWNEFDEGDNDDGDDEWHLGNNDDDEMERGGGGRRWWC